MCSRQRATELGERNLTLLNTSPKKVLTLEELYELQLNEQIEIEDELADIIRSYSISKFIDRHKR